MKLALVHDFLLRFGGAERTLKVLADIFPDAPIYTLLYDAEKMAKYFPPERIHSSFLQANPLARKHPQWFLKSLPRACEELDLSQYDTVLTSSSAFAKGVLTPPKTRVITYCHRPMGYAWDWTHEYLGEKHMNPIAKLYARHVLNGVRQWDRASVNRTDLWLANSQTTQARLAKYYRVKSTLVYPPVDVRRFRVNATHQDYFLIVSALQSFKRIDLAISAFNYLQKELIIIGDGAEFGRLQKLAGPTVHLLGRRSDKEVKVYLENCRGFIFPGEEDFGIAPVEAMACGKPVLAYGKGGVMETVVAHETGEFFAEPTVESLLDGLARLLAQQYDPTVIRRRAEKFERENFERTMKKIIWSK